MGKPDGGRSQVSEDYTFCQKTQVRPEEEQVNNVWAMNTPAKESYQGVSTSPNCKPKPTCPP